jgi:hypothetical protein
MVMTTQVNRLLEHLQNGRSIDRISSFRKLGIFELSARICDLEKLGHKIVKTRKKIRNRFEEEVTVVEYKLEQN